MWLSLIWRLALHLYTECIKYFYYLIVKFYMFYKVCFIFNYFWDFWFLVFYCLVIYCLVFYIQWPKEKVRKDKQRSTKHTYKTKDRVTRTPLNTGGEFRCSGRVSSSCSTSSTRRVNLVTNPVISRDVCHACSMRSLVFKVSVFSLTVLC